MHYIHSVAFIPLHFKFKMKTSVKINLKVLFVNNYDWTEPPNLWHFTNEIRIKAFQTRNNNFAIFSLMSIASDASLKIEMPLKMLLKMHTCTCTMYHMWYVLYILSLNFTEKQLVWVAEFVQHKLNWLSSYIIFFYFTEIERISSWADQEDWKTNKVGLMMFTGSVQNISKYLTFPTLHTYHEM